MDLERQDTSWGRSRFVSLDRLRGLWFPAVVGSGPGDPDLPALVVRGRIACELPESPAGIR